MTANVEPSAGKDAGASEQEMYLVKEVPTWHGQQDTRRFASTGAATARQSALALMSTPASTTAGHTLSRGRTQGRGASALQPAPIAPAGEDAMRLLPSVGPRPSRDLFQCPDGRTHRPEPVALFTGEVVGYVCSLCLGDSVGGGRYED